MLITASFVSAQEMCTRSAECRTQHIERICGTREPCTGRSRPARTLSRPRWASARCACRMLQLQSSQGAMLCLHLTRPWISLGSQKSRRVQHVLVIVLFDLLVLLYQGAGNTLEVASGARKTGGEPARILRSRLCSSRMPLALLWSTFRERHPNGLVDACHDSCCTYLTSRTALSGRK